MDGKFTRKSRIVAGGHKTEPTKSIFYYSVVTRESVRMAFLISGLNNLDICACYIGNVYLYAPCQENCGPKLYNNWEVRKDRYY